MIDKPLVELEASIAHFKKELDEADAATKPMYANALELAHSRHMLSILSLFGSAFTGNKEGVRIAIDGLSEDSFLAMVEELENAMKLIRAIAEERKYS